MESEIETERLRLRSFAPEDAAVVQRELSRVEMGRTLAVPHPYPENGAETFIATAQPGRDFAIALRKTDEVVGGLSVVISERHGRAELAYWVAISHWGRGYATEAARAAVDHAFRALEVNRVYAECHADNPASRRVLETVGMTLEGRLRQHSYRVDRRVDKLVFGVLRCEWRSLQ